MIKKKLITEKEILNLIFKGKKKFEVTGNELFTPAAKDKINEAGIRLVKAELSNADGKIITQGPFYKFKKVAIGALDKSALPSSSDFKPKTRIDESVPF